MGSWYNNCCMTRKEADPSVPDNRELPRVEQSRAGRESFAFLEGVAPQDTFKAARENLAEIFSDAGSDDPKLIDKKRRDLLTTYGEDACLSVLARTEHIAVELKKVLEGTGILQPGSRAAVTDQTVEDVRKFLLALQPLGSTASEEVWQNYPASTRAYDLDHAQKYGYTATTLGTYNYPEWDQLFKNAEGEIVSRFDDPDGFIEASIVPQELNYYHRLMTHVSLTPVFVEEMLGPINRKIEMANRGGTVLEEGPFGYLRQEDGSYRTIDINRMKVRMLLHDIGRWATHHQYLHESLPDLIAHFLGMKPPLIRYEFDHELRYFSPDEKQVFPENIPIEETVFHFVDFNAKRANEGDLESIKLRELEQLVEHAIVRAVGYNGKQREYLDFVELERPDLEAKVKKAFELLDVGEGKQNREVQFVKREIMFLQRVIPFFDGDIGRRGVFEDVGASLQQVINAGERELERLVDSADLFAYNRGEKETVAQVSIPLRKKIRYSLEGMMILGQMAVASIKPRRK